MGSPPIRTKAAKRHGQTVPRPVGQIDLDKIGLNGTPADARRYSNERLSEVFSAPRDLARVIDECGYYAFWPGLNSADLLVAENASPPALAQGRDDAGCRSPQSSAVL